MLTLVLVGLAWLLVSVATALWIGAMARNMHAQIPSSDLGDTTCPGHERDMAPRADRIVRQRA